MLFSSTLFVQTKSHPKLACGNICVYLITCFSIQNENQTTHKIGHSTETVLLSMLSTVLRWFQSYLIGCFQCINIGSILSELRRLLYSVPRGSVPGPILFWEYDLTLISLFLAQSVCVNLLKNIEGSQKTQTASDTKSGCEGYE